MNDFEIIKYSVYNALGVSYKNALTRRELCRKTGCNDRTLRKAIESLRQDHPILSRDDGRGYYLPETTEEGREETERWIGRQNSRINSIKAAQTGAKKFVRKKKKRTNNMPSQINVFTGGNQYG